MTESDNNRRVLSPESRKIFMKAMDKFNATGTSMVKCDECGEIIEFQKNNTAVIHKCKCGKYNGSLRGL